MIRYRSARTTPGVNPTISMTSAEASLPTFEDEPGFGRRAAAATDGEAMFVGSWETDETASPQEGQKRAESGIPALQLEQAAGTNLILTSGG
jgi:hypothetical protein